MAELTSFGIINKEAHESLQVQFLMLEKHIMQSQK